MKIWALLLCSTALAVTLVAQAPAAKTPPNKAGADKSAKKDEEPPAKIDGVEIPRGEGFMGLQIVDANFRLSFYDKKKKPILADVTQAVLRWQPNYQKAEERVLLERSGDGKYLTSPRVIRPPHVFKLSIVLFNPPAAGAEAVATENFIIDFAAQ